MRHSASCHIILVHFRNYLSEFGHCFQGLSPPEGVRLRLLKVSHGTAMRTRASAIERRMKRSALPANCICDEMRDWDDEPVQMQDEPAYRSGEESWNRESSMITVHHQCSLVRALGSLILFLRFSNHASLFHRCEYEIGLRQAWIHLFAAWKALAVELGARTR
jgi:hypothetical protein